MRVQLTGCLNRYLLSKDTVFAVQWQLYLDMPSPPTANMLISLSELFPGTGWDDFTVVVDGECMYVARTNTYLAEAVVDDAHDALTQQDLDQEVANMHDLEEAGFFVNWDDVIPLWSEGRWKPPATFRPDASRKHWFRNKRFAWPALPAAIETHHVPKLKFGVAPNLESVSSASPAGAVRIHVDGALEVLTCACGDSDLFLPFTRRLLKHDAYYCIVCGATYVVDRDATRGDQPCPGQKTK